MADVDIVVVSYNSRDHLRACVEDLSRSPETHVIVVDSASQDRSLEVIADLPVTRIGLRENRGFAYACNEGVRSGTSPYILLLNPDARLDHEALDLLVAVLENDPALGAIGPRIVDEDGVLQHSIRTFPRAASSFAQALFLHRIWPRAPWVDELVRDQESYARAHAVDWISGACILLPRQALETVEGLDAGFFLYREDADLCKRLQDAGYRVWFEPRSSCVHVGGASRPGEELLGVLAVSRIRYARKHGGAPAARIEQAGVLLGAATHAVLGAGGFRRRLGHLRAFRAGLRGASGTYSAYRR
jgi:N-acetylglucosaminyl-diphospho-decaprenol L-rhamnosyltransferase